MHKNILSTINLWIKFLDDYDEKMLLFKPSPEKWSLGQVYKHIWSETTYFVSQAAISYATNENKDLKMTLEAEVMFANNSFPDEQIVGPPSNDLTPQPQNKQEILDDLQCLRESLISLTEVQKLRRCKGKTMHPGLGYFNADEWIQFADMHLKHHIKQKDRLDELLGKK